MQQYVLGPEGQRVWATGLHRRFDRSAHSAWKDVADAVRAAWAAQAKHNDRPAAPAVTTLTSDLSRLRQPTPEVLKRWFSSAAGLRVQCLEQALQLETGDLRRLLEQGQIADRSGSGDAPAEFDPLVRFVAPPAASRSHWERVAHDGPEGLIGSLASQLAARLPQAEASELFDRWRDLVPEGLEVLEQRAPDDDEPSTSSKAADVSLVVVAPLGTGGTTLHAWLYREATWLAARAAPGRPPLRVTWRSTVPRDRETSEVSAPQRPDAAVVVELSRTETTFADWTLTTWSNDDVARLAERYRQLPSAGPMAEAELSDFAAQLRKGDVNLPPAISAREADDIILAVSQDGAPRSPGAVRERLVEWPLRRLAKALGRDAVPEAVRHELQGLWGRLLARGAVAYVEVEQLPSTLRVDRRRFDHALSELTIPAEPRNDLARRLREALPAGRLVNADRARLAEVIALAAAELERPAGPWLSDALRLAGLVAFTDPDWVAVDTRTLLVEGVRGLLRDHLYPGRDTREMLSPWLADELGVAGCREGWLQALVEQAEPGACVDTWLFVSRVLARRSGGASTTTDLRFWRTAADISAVCCHLGWPGHDLATASELAGVYQADDGRDLSIDDLAPRVVSELAAGVPAILAGSQSLDAALRQLVRLVRRAWCEMFDATVIAVELGRWRVKQTTTGLCAVEEDRELLDPSYDDLWVMQQMEEHQGGMDATRMAYPSHYEANAGSGAWGFWEPGRLGRLQRLGASAWLDTLEVIVGRWAAERQQPTREDHDSNDVGRFCADVVSGMPAIATDLFLDELFAGFVEWWHGSTQPSPTEHLAAYLAAVKQAVTDNVSAWMEEHDDSLGWTAPLARWWLEAHNKHQDQARTSRDLLAARSRLGPFDEFSALLKGWDITPIRSALETLRPATANATSQANGDEAIGRRTLAGEPTRYGVETSVPMTLESAFEACVLDGVSEVIVARAATLVAHGPAVWSEVFVSLPKNRG